MDGASFPSCKILSGVRGRKTATFSDVALTCQMKFPKMDKDLFDRNGPSKGTRHAVQLALSWKIRAHVLVLILR
jgi:hypothetical protein